jgi:hypothetical protein
MGRFIAKNPVFSLFGVTGCLVLPTAVQPKVLPACCLAIRSCLRTFYADRLTLDPVFTHQIAGRSVYMVFMGWCYGAALREARESQRGRHEELRRDDALLCAEEF